jgi:glucarate dehydratase
MRITGLSATHLRMPLQAPTLWALGRHASIPRLLVQLETDEGISGIGETYHVPEADRLLVQLAELLAPLDPLHVTAVRRRIDTLAGSYDTIVPLGLRAAIEMACLDAAGKALGVPVSSLLGGAVRDEIEAAAYLFYRERSADGRRGGEDSSEAIVARAEELVELHGFRTLKLKGGVYGSDQERAALRSLASRFPGAPLRWDPNAAWSVPEALAAVDGLRRDGIWLEYLEDPVADLAGMAALHRRVDVPLATNMCVVQFDQLAPAIEMRAVDVVLADPHYWGGLVECRRLMAVCDAFRIGVGMHSDNDLGVSTAARLHLAAASPELSFAIDLHTPEHTDELLVEPLVCRSGVLRVPAGPGLGVVVDPEAVERLREA